MSILSKHRKGFIESQIRSYGIMREEVVELFTTIRLANKNTTLTPRVLTEVTAFMNNKLNRLREELEEVKSALAADEYRQRRKKELLSKFK